MRALLCNHRARDGSEDLTVSGQRGIGQHTDKTGTAAAIDDAWRFADFVAEFNQLFEIDREHTEGVKRRVQDFLRAKKPGQTDSEDLLKIKKLVRATEARAAALACGIGPEQLEFMDLRFYRTGTIAKAPIHPQDIADIVALLQRLQPAQAVHPGAR